LVIWSSGSHNSDTSEDDGQPPPKRWATHQPNNVSGEHRDWPDSLVEPKSTKTQKMERDTHKQNRRGSTQERPTLSQLFNFGRRVCNLFRLNCEMVFLEQWPIHYATCQSYAQSWRSNHSAIDCKTQRAISVISQKSGRSFLCRPLIGLGHRGKRLVSRRDGNANCSKPLDFLVPTILSVKR
jgi:hypothetical protein